MQRRSVYCLRLQMEYAENFMEFRLIVRQTVYCCVCVHACVRQKIYFLRVIF